MTNQIAAIRNYTNILDAVYQKASVSDCLTSGGRMVRAGKNAKEIMVSKITVSGLGNYTRNVGTRRGQSASTTRPRRSTTTAASSFWPT